MSWKIIEIENGHTLKLFLSNLVIYHENDKITIPISDIDVLLINNTRINISIQLLNALADDGVLVIICNNRYIPNINVLPIHGHYNTMKIFESQLAWTRTYKSNLWKWIIKTKIQNQKHALSYFKISHEYNDLFDQYCDQIKEFDISNREGHASKIYWNIMFGLKFTRRDDCYINKLLNYGYAILNSYVCRSIVKKGLDPRIALFHKSFNNHFALSSDLMEIFRVLIDLKVYEIIILRKEDQYDHKHKEELINVFNTKIMVNQKMLFINKAIDIFLDAVSNQTKLPEYDFFVQKITLDYESV